MIAFIFGETDFPKYIYKKFKGRKNYLIIDLTKKNIFKKDKNSYSVSIGQFGKIISILKKNNCSRVLFAGKVKKPNFAKLKLDVKGIFYISGIIKKLKLGDAAIIKEIISIFKKEGIKTIRSNFFTPELTLTKGNYSNYQPDLEDKKNILNALKSLKKTNPYDHVQSAVSKNNFIVLEKNEGTEEMLKKIKKKKGIRNGVLVKYPKKKQDTRIDLPTVGIETLKQCKRAGLKGIVLKHRKNIFLDKSNCIKYANKNKIFVTVK